MNHFDATTLLTPTEAVQRFGLNVLSEDLQRQYKENPYDNKKYSFIHVIRPRLKKGKLSKGKINKNLPWASIYVEKSTNLIVRESGYHEMPVIVPRWNKIPDTEYAVGAVHDALPDIKSLNHIMRLVLLNADMTIQGAYTVLNDGVTNPNTIKITPRQLIPVESHDSIKPLANGGDMNFALVQIERLQASIRKTLLADQLGPTEKMNMTATEVQTRTNLIRTILGPIFGRLQAEYLYYLVERCFGLCFRAGILGEPPESLNQYKFGPVYRSPMVKAQKAQEIQAMDQFENHLLQYLQLDPSLADLYDIQNSIRKRAEYLGVDIELIRDKKQFDKIQQQKRNQQQNQQQQQAGQPGQPSQEQMLQQLMQQAG